MEYIDQGGNLFVIGAKSTREFSDILDVDFVGKDSTAQFNIGDKQLGGIAGIKTQWQPVIAKKGTETIGHVYHQRDYRFATEYPVATINQYGKGKIAAIYTDMFTAYNTYRNPVFNNLINKVIGQFVVDPTLKVEGSDKVHVLLGKKGDATLIHLINSSGEHFNKNVLAYDGLRPTPNLKMTLKSDKKPKKIKLQPSNEALKFTYKNGLIEIQVPAVEVYDIIEIEN